VNLYRFIPIILLTLWGFNLKCYSIQIIDEDSVLSNLKGKERLEYLNQSATQLRESDQEKTLIYSFEADSLGLLLKDNSARSRALENIGWIHYRKGNWRKSFDYSRKAFELAIDDGDKLQAARLMNSMGALYYEQHDYSKSIEQFKKGYELATEVGDLSTRVRSLNNIALSFGQIHQQDSAQYYAQRSINLNGEVGSPHYTSFALRIIGDVYLAKGNYDTAQVLFSQSLKLARIQGLKSFQAGILHRLGNAYLLGKKLSQAEEILSYAVDFCRENQFLEEQSKSHKNLAQVFYQKGNIHQAYFHQSEFIVLNDSLVNKTNRDRLILLQGMFERDLADSELELLKAQNENQLLRIETFRKYSIILAIAALLIALLGIRMFLLHRNVSKINQDLLAQQKKIEEQNQELEGQSQELKSINETKSKLFSILGHDLRGPIGQIKTVVDLMDRNELEKEEFFELIGYLKKDIDSVYFTLNNTLKWSISQMEGFEINPQEYNLTDIVRNSLGLLQASIKDKNLVVFNRLNDKTSVYGDPDLVEVAVRNVVNNAVKFSNPGDAITIYAEKDENWINLFVLDQGVGMNQEKINEILSDAYTITKSKPGTQKEKGSGLGLQLVKEFVNMNGGEIEIESNPGHGTKFCLKLPNLKSQLDSSRPEEVLQS
jgi:signal transduction histidine kinase